MTAQAETAQDTNSGATLEPVAPGALARVNSDKPWTIDDLAALLAGPAPEFAAAGALPSAPAKVKLTEVLRKALRALPDLFGAVMPDEARALDRHEIRALTDEANAISTVMTELSARREAIKECIRNHQDAQAEAAGLPDGAVRIADGSARGHWLVAEQGRPFESAVDGYTDCWQQRFVSGKVTVSGHVVGDLYEAGEIDRAAYLACTSERRSYDPDKMQAFIRKDPVLGLRILARMTTRSAPSASVYAPKK